MDYHFWMPEFSCTCLSNDFLILFQLKIKCSFRCGTCRENLFSFSMFAIARWMKLYLRKILSGNDMCNVLPLPPMLMPLDKYAFWKNRKGLNMLLFHFFFSFYIVFRLLAFNQRYLAGEKEFMCDINQFFLLHCFLGQWHLTWDICQEETKPLLQFHIQQKWH